MNARIAGVVLLAGAIGACDSATVPERQYLEVYDFRLETIPPTVLRWPTGSTVRIYAHGGSDVARSAELQEAVRHAAQAWNQAVRFGEYRIVVVTSVESADAVVRWSTDDPPVVVSDCPPSGGRAYTTFCLTADGSALEPFPIPGMNASSVRFLATIRAAEAGDAARVRGLVTHEIGHVLGIAQHSDNVADLMYDGELIRDVPNVRDRATIQLLYHTTPDILP